MAAVSETRALLLTDVVDSTQLSERIGDAAMAEVWAAHDRAARDLLPPWRGREIDKTDGMLMLFERAADAAGYALAYHRALAVLQQSLALEAPLLARAGLHVGPVILRENSAEHVARGAKPLEVDGLAKPTAARVMSLARGGQTLATPEARLALDAAGHELALVSHGHWLMKGLTEPVELFELAAAGTPEGGFTAPTDSDKVHRVVRQGERWVPVRQIANNLPQTSDSFVGRERELAEVKQMLGTHRLVTLLGMGGLGKTRLSLQAAIELMPNYSDGAWFIDLAPLRDPALVVGEVAQVLEVRDEPGRPLLQTLAARLRDKRLLLIFDNCEHLVQAAADLVHALLRAAPQLHILASSREALRVAGEQAYPVYPLPLPQRGDSLAALSRSTAVRLFVDRARQHKPDFELDEREGPAVAALVLRLEGIPLALELAAARVRSLSVSDINARLQDRYKLLTGGGRDVLPRQQTLRALVDWSYDMLLPDEQIALERLAVFAGGFDLSAAEAVCGADPLASDDMLDLMASLVEKSLLMLDERGERTRYRMLMTIRDYAQIKLQQRGEIAEAAARHALHFFEFAKQAGRGMRSPQQAEWTRRFEDEHDNLRAATALALASGVDPLIAVKLAVSMLGFWMLHGYATEGRAVVRAALALPEVDVIAMARAHALYTGACLAGSQSDLPEALQMLESCLELRRGLGNPVELAATLSTLSLTRLQAGDADGAARAEDEALALFRQTEDRFGEAISLVHLGQIGIVQGDDAMAIARAGQALDMAQSLRHPELEAECQRVLGEAAYESGETAQALQWLEKSLVVCEASGDTRGLVQAKAWLGRVALAAGDAQPEADTRGMLSAALLAFNDFEMRAELLAVLEDLAELIARRGNLALAARLASFVDTRRGRRRLVRHARAALRWERRLAAWHQSLGEADFNAAVQSGRALESSEAVSLALRAADA